MQIKYSDGFGKLATQLFGGVGKYFTCSFTLLVFRFLLPFFVSKIFLNCFEAQAKWMASPNPHESKPKFQRNDNKDLRL